jgi:D-sedoheptulose 7-phosphate isomerase
MSFDGATRYHVTVVAYRTPVNYGTGVNLLNTVLILDQAIGEHVAAIESVRTQVAVLQQIATRMTDAVLTGNKIFWCGNGGSAADAQHLAAELVGRFKRERKGMSSVALTTDTSILTSVGNDYGFEYIFSRQVEALCTRGDVVVGITTSGNSKNVCAALRVARDLGAFTVAFTGEVGGLAAQISDISLCIASKETARIQEAHIFSGHILCDWVEECFCMKHPITEGSLKQ